MKLDEMEIKKLEDLCTQFRMDVLNILHERQTGHPGGSLSVCEILATLYMKKMRVDPQNPTNANRDRLVLCKGHAAPMLYRVLAEKGFFSLEELHTLRKINTRMQGHPCMRDTPGVDLSSGPLGIGLSAALGMSQALKLQNSSARVYAVLGDGELNEGTVWEACMAASKLRADNLCAIVDWNGVQLDGTTAEVMPMDNLRARFESFGWNTIEVDGHNIEALWLAFDLAEQASAAPTVILAHTVKGKGVSFMEGKSEWHGKAIDDWYYQLAIKELGGNL